MNKHDIGYSLHPNDGPKMSHRLYMDDVKLYTVSEEDMQTLVNTTAEFSADIKLQFELDKCATIRIKKGTKAAVSR